MKRKENRREHEAPAASAEVDPSARRRRWMRVRIGLLASLVLVGAVLVTRRAWELTIEHGPALRAMAEQQQLRDIRLAPKRGTIYDRHGAELAVSVDVESVFANPRLMRARGVDTDRAAADLARVLDLDRAVIATRLRQDRYFVWIERQVSPVEADAVRSLAIEGVQMTDEARRFYPNRELAAHLLGFANVDGVGIEGLELSMEERLRGAVDPVPAVRDRRGRVVFSDQLLDERAAQGDDLYLTIDKTIQHVVERELALGVQTAEARAGSVVVMDPQTGEILAMASYPTFNPNEPGRSPTENRRNRAIADRLEPGSTIKPFTVSAALAAGVIRPDQLFDVSGNDPHGTVGRMHIGDDVIRDTHPRAEPITASEVLIYSSNIGAALIGNDLGRHRLYRSFRRFGFGEPTGVPLPGETGGVLRHHTRWYDLDLATISFGQGMSATTLQLATAMSAIANGGRLMEPHLVARIVDGHGTLVEEALPRVERQVIPARTARLVADMLTAVTGEGGTGPQAAIDGYLVAGKTGTAQKADHRRGGYAADLYVASFVGFVPAQDPRLVIAVVIDEPMVNHYGGPVAGPVFRRIGQATLRHLGVPAETGGDALAEIERRLARAERAGARAEADADAAPPMVVEREPRDGEVVVPDLAGRTVRAALLELRRVGLAFRVEGTGLVLAQDPSPGAVAPRGTTVRLVLERAEAGAREPVAASAAPRAPRTRGRTLTTVVRP
ncbi:MAG: PASTA domain-containing protein [Sandaracinaceae bacterium]|nr:PASTA domain-containing protein [Sandaracinaceae bacterium]